MNIGIPIDQAYPKVKPLAQALIAAAKEQEAIGGVLLFFLFTLFHKVRTFQHNVLDRGSRYAVDFGHSVIAAQLHIVSNDFLFSLVRQPCSHVTTSRLSRVFRSSSVSPNALSLFLSFLEDKG